MTIVIARAEVDPADVAEIKPILDAMMRATWEESGCLSYSMAIESESRGIISVVERWTDEGAVKSHFATPHMATFNAAAQRLLKSVDIKMYDATNERPLTL